MATKVSRKKSRASRVILALFVVALMGAIALFILEKTKTTDFIKMPVATPQSGPTKEQTEQQQRAEISAKQQFIDTTDATGKPLAEATTPSVEQPSTSIELTTKQDGSSVTILTKMQNISDGTCRLTITNGGKNTSQTAQVIYQPEFSSCAGFSVPVSSLGSGAWNISLGVVSTGGTETTKATTLVVQ